MSAINPDDFKKVIELFKAAESKLKSTELQVFETDIPSINELRYAGHHIVKYISGEEKSNLERAEKHCKRAIYDAHELYVVDSLEQIRLFENDYRKSVNIAAVIHDFPLKIADVNRINCKMNTVREEEYEDRDQYYARISSDKDRLLDIVEELTCARIEINKLDINDENRRVTELRRYVVLAGLALIAILASLNYDKMSQCIDGEEITPQPAAVTMNFQQMVKGE